eukprot:m.71805 g.71805  ORF g.71805 m.71805 type:complete len:775 (+) comp12278_c0_seq3:113-2437(+)
MMAQAAQSTSDPKDASDVADKLSKTLLEDVQLPRIEDLNLPPEAYEIIDSLKDPAKDEELWERMKIVLELMQNLEEDSVSPFEKAMYSKMNDMISSSSDERDNLLYMMRLMAVQRVYNEEQQNLHEAYEESGLKSEGTDEKEIMQHMAQKELNRLLPDHLLSTMQTEDENDKKSAMDLVKRLEDRGTRNPLVPQGLKGADVLGLRKIENSHMVSLRGQGDVAVRKSRLQDEMSIVGERAYKMELDDSWEDETGFVRCKAKGFVCRGQRHDARILPPQHNPLRPKLALLHDLRGRPCPPSPPKNVSKKDLEEYIHRWAADTKTKDGTFKVGVSEGLAVASMSAPEIEVEELPVGCQGLLDTIVNGRTSKTTFQMSPSSNLQSVGWRQRFESAQKNQLKFLRVTNLGDFKTPPKGHIKITWAEILGQHCSSFFESEPELRVDPNLGFDEDDGLLSSAASSSNGFQISFLDESAQDDSLAEVTDYCVDLIQTRFAQFTEYLDRKPEQRECVMCKKPGGECVPLTIGDSDISGAEWEDPHCWHMFCPGCICELMAKCDITGEFVKQRCRECGEQFGGWQKHNIATKKLMLLQAATQVLLFFGPRTEGQPEETFDERMMRRALIQAVIDFGLKPAMDIKFGANLVAECWVQGGNDLTSGGWMLYAAVPGDTTTLGYDYAALHGRLLLRMCEVEAMLENFDAAAAYAARAADLLSTLDRGSVRSVRDKLKRHPARQLIIPARSLAKELRKRQNQSRLHDQNGNDHKKHKHKKNKKGKKKK